MNNDRITEFVKNRIRAQKWSEVVNGKTAIILSATPDGEEELYIDANKVFMQCKHCGKITNKTYEVKKDGRKLSRRS